MGTGTNHTNPDAISIWKAERSLHSFDCCRTCLLLSATITLRTCRLDSHQGIRQNEYRIKNCFECDQKGSIWSGKISHVSLFFFVALDDLTASSRLLRYPRLNQS